MGTACVIWAAAWESQVLALPELTHQTPVKVGPIQILQVFHTHRDAISAQ
jgi:hypothetical protein